MANINDFTLIEIDFWNRPIWKYKDGSCKVCLVDMLFTFKELKEKLDFVLKSINNGSLTLYYIYNKEPEYPINLDKIPEKDIIIKNELF